MRFSPDAPIQIGGCGCCTGRGNSVASFTWKCLPSNVNASVVSSPRTICTASSNASMRSFESRERDAELGVLLVEPRRAVRQLEPTARRVVDRDRLGREHRRMAVRHAGHEQAEPDAFGDARSARRASCCLRSTRPGPSPYIGWKWSKPQTPSKPSSSAKRALRRDLRPRHPLLCDVESEPHNPLSTRRAASRGSRERHANSRRVLKTRVRFADVLLLDSRIHRELERV